MVPGPHCMHVQDYMTRTCRSGFDGPFYIADGPTLSPYRFFGPQGRQLALEVVYGQLSPVQFRQKTCGGWQQPSALLAWLASLWQSSLCRHVLYVECLPAEAFESNLLTMGARILLFYSERVFSELHPVLRLRIDK